jgi:hypothetical protein
MTPPIGWWMSARIGFRPVLFRRVLCAARTRCDFRDLQLAIHPRPILDEGQSFETEGTWGSGTINPK